jgi:hypothetical protein
MDGLGPFADAFPGFLRGQDGEGRCQTPIESLSLGRWCMKGFC